MNVKSISLIAGLVTVFGSGAALAADEYLLNQNVPSPVAASPAPRATVQTVAVNEFQRNQYPELATPSKLQRAQVVAEAIEARKLGLLNQGEQSLVPTASQAEQIRMAGLRAVNDHVAAK